MDKNCIDADVYSIPRIVRTDLEILDSNNSKDLW